MRITTQELYAKLVSTSDATIDRPGKICPRVGVVIASEVGADTWRVVSTASHGLRELERGRTICTHAEEVAIEEWHMQAGDIRLSDCTVFTSLEPCTERSAMMCDCTDRLIGAGAKRVVVGLLDPDPQIFGRGVARLRANNVNVSYLPKDIRETLAKQNADFIARKQREYRMDKFDETLPCFVTNYDLEGYLRTAHALLRMYHGKRVVWYYPELPSLADQYRFHAWFAQGLFLNKEIETIDLIMDQTRFKDAVKRSLAAARPSRASYLDTVLEETSSEARTRVYVTSSEPKGRNPLILFYNSTDQLEYLIQAIPMELVLKASSRQDQPHVALAVMRASEAELHDEVERTISEARERGGMTLHDAIAAAREEISSD